MTPARNFPAGWSRPLANASFVDVMSRRGDLDAIAVARTPGLAAFAKAGLSLSATLPGRADETLHLRLGGVNALADGAQAVLLSDGRVVVGGGGVLAAAEVVIALEEALKCRSKLRC